MRYGEPEACPRGAREPAKEGADPWSRVEETSRALEEFPALGPAVYLGLSLLLRDFP